MGSRSEAKVIWPVRSGLFGNSLDEKRTIGNTAAAPWGIGNTEKHLLD
jgi:hypothetical protein